MSPRRIVTLAVGLVAMPPGPAVAQTQSPWSIVNVTTQVCPAFVGSGDIRQARADAESQPIGDGLRGPEINVAFRARS